MLRRPFDQTFSNSSSRSASRARTPRIDSDENGNLDFNFNSLEEVLTAKLEDLQAVVDKESEAGNITSSDARQSNVEQLNKLKIHSKDTTINDIIYSLSHSRADVSSQSREMLLAQLYKLIVVKSLIVYNEENPAKAVTEVQVEDLISIFMRKDYRSATEFLLLFRSTIALIASDIDEFGSLADSEFIRYIQGLINDPPTSYVTNANKSHLITGLVGLLMILHNGSSAYGIDDTINWLFEISEGHAISSLTGLKDFKEGNREYSTYFDELSENRIVQDAMDKQSGDALVGIAGLHGVGCLLTLLPRGEFLNTLIETIVPKALELLDNDQNIEIAKASGRLIAICYEAFTYDNNEEANEDEDDEYNYNSPFYEQELLTNSIQRLGNISSKKLGKKDKKEIHSIFNDILQTIRNYSKLSTRIEIYKKSPRGMELLNESMNSNFIKLSRTKTLMINSWFLYLRLIHLKWCFSFGVHNQLVSNTTIRSVLREPETEYELKYGQSDNHYYSDDEAGYPTMNAKHEVDDKKRTEKLRKERVKKLEEEMEDLELSSNTVISIFYLHHFANVSIGSSTHGFSSLVVPIQFLFHNIDDTVNSYQSFLSIQKGQSGSSGQEIYRCSGVFVFDGIEQFRNSERLIKRLIGQNILFVGCNGGSAEALSTSQTDWQFIEVIAVVEFQNQRCPRSVVVGQVLGHFDRNRVFVDQSGSIVFGVIFTTGQNDLFGLAVLDGLGEVGVLDNMVESVFGHFPVSGPFTTTDGHQTRRRGVDQMVSNKTLSAARSTFRRSGSRISAQRSHS